MLETVSLMLKTFTALAIALSASGLALAATDGTLGDSSSGTAEITINVTETSGAQIQVTGLEDINLTAERNVPYQGSSVFRVTCVYMDQPGEYSIALEATPLTITSGLVIGEYQVAYVELSSQKTVAETVTDETVTLRLAGIPASNDATCQTGNVSPAVGIDLEPSSPSTQSGIATATITLTVSPE